MHSGDGQWPMPGVYPMAAPSLLEVGGSFMLLTQLSPSFCQYGEAYTFMGLAENQPVHPPSLHVGEGSSLSGCVPRNNRVNSKSVVGVKPGYPGLVIRHQVYEFKHTWFVEYFVAQLHIYQGFTGKV